MRVAASALVVLAASLALAGCGGTRANVVAPATDLHLSGNWNDADSRAVAEALVPDALAGGWLARFAEERGRAPVVRVGHVHVRVQDLDESIDPEIVTNDLVRALLASGRARAVASRAEADMAEGTRDGRAEMAVHAAEAPAQGRETAADYLLAGVIVSQNDEGRDEGVTSDTFRRVKYYHVTLTLTDLTSNEVVWSGKGERKKVIEQSSIGF